jgi:hypothetical protein
MLPIRAMERAIRCLFLALAITGLGCASDYTERYRRAHPDWRPTPPAAGDSFEKTVASIHAGVEGGFDVSVRELRVMRVDVEPWEVLSVDSVAAGPPQQIIGVIAARRCNERRGIRFYETGRVSWYIFVGGELTSYDHFEFGETCRALNHYLPSRAEQVSTERALIRYAAQRHPASAPTTEEMLGKGMALVSADRLSDAERMLRNADRALDFMAGERERRPEQERQVLDEEEKRLRALRAQLARAIVAARRQRQQTAD